MCQQADLHGGFQKSQNIFQKKSAENFVIKKMYVTLHRFKPLTLYAGGKRERLFSSVGQST